MRFGAGDSNPIPSHCCRNRPPLSVRLVPPTANTFGENAGYSGSIRPGQDHVAHAETAGIDPAARNLRAP